MRILPVLAASLLLAGPALAADTPTVDPKAEELLASFAKYYTNAKTFQTRIATSLIVDAQGEKAENTGTYDLSVQRPDSLALVFVDGKIGGTVITTGGQRTIYAPTLKRYSVAPAPADLGEWLDEGALNLFLAGLPFGHESLYTSDIAASLRDNAASITYAGTNTVNGQPAHQITFRNSQVSASIWIAADGPPLLLKSDLAVNIDSMAPELVSQMGLKEFRRVSTYTDWKINQPIPAATFAFQPPAGTEKVDAVAPRSRADEPHPLLGQPAPDFTLKDLAGKDVSLSSLRGKIVVLDFWATWCLPCIKSLPSVSAIAKSFADKGVVFYAINDQEDASTIKEFLQANKLDIPVLLDTDAAVRERYNSPTLPQEFIIDREGIIRVARSGIRPDYKQQLTKELTEITSGSAPAK